MALPHERPVRPPDDTSVPGSSARSADWASDRSRHGGADELPLPPGTGGRVWLAGKHFVAPDPEGALAYLGADTVVCFNEASELDRYPDYVTWLLAQSPTRALWRPIPDLGTPGLDSTLELLDELASRLREGQGLLIHCGAGVGRAGTMAAGLLVLLGQSLDAATAHVRRHRPMAGPEAGPQAQLLAELWARVER